MNNIDRRQNQRLTNQRAAIRRLKNSTETVRVIVNAANDVPTSYAGLSDCTSAVQAIVNTMPNGGNLHFLNAGTPFKTAGTINLPAGHLWEISGDMTEIVSTAGQPIFEVGYGATGNTDGFRMSGLKLTCNVDADYGSGLLILRWMRCFDIDVDFDLSGTGTAVLLDTSYVGRLRGNWRCHRYATGVELDGRLNPTAQLDSIHFEARIFSTSGIIIRGGQVDQAFRFTGTMAVSSPDYQTYAETTLTGATSAGATSFSVASAAGFAVNDPICIDYGVKVEVNKVTNISGTTITVARPLRYAHSSGRLILKGGFCVSLSDKVQGATFPSGHFEGAAVMCLAENPRNLSIGQALFSSCLEMLRPYGTMISVVIGQVCQGSSTQTRNYIVNDDNVTSTPQLSWIDGPVTSPVGTTAPTFSKAGQFQPLGSKAMSAPLVTRLSANTSAVNNSTTPVDSGLAQNFPPNTTWYYRGTIGYQASTAADVALKWSRPSGATMNGTVDSLDNASTGTSGSIQRVATTQASTMTGGGAGAGTTAFMFIEGVLHVFTAGQLKLQFAQRVADASDTILTTDSILVFRQIP